MTARAVSTSAPGYAAAPRPPRALPGSRALRCDPTIAHRTYALVAPQPRDPTVASQSGINGSVVEPATLVTDRGHHLAAVRSVEPPARVPPRRRRLADIADVVPRAGAPYGDALLPIHGGAVCAGPPVSAVQRLTAGVVRRFHLATEVPPIHLWANVPGGTSTTTPSGRATSGTPGVRPDPN